MQGQKEDYTEIAEMFERMAKNESMHGKIKVEGRWRYRNSPSTKGKSA